MPNTIEEPAAWRGGLRGRKLSAAMHQVLRYFRKHPWQRLVVTLSAAAVAGLAIALIAKPIATDLLLIHRMGSNDPAVRELAVIQAVTRGKESEATIRRLDCALDTADNDTKFAALATALNLLGRFNKPGRDPRQLDRWWAIQLKTTAQADSRLLILDQIVRIAFTTGRRNEHIRRACALGAADGQRYIRARAALLAAVIKDDKTLEKLLTDEQSAVKAAAILDAGLAGRDHLVERFAPPLLASPEVEVASSAAYALHHRGGNKAGELLASALGECKVPALRDRLLHVLSLRRDEAAANAVRKVILAGKAAGEIPSAMALLAAGKLKVAEAAPEVQAALAGATRAGSSLTEPQLLAALQAADMLDMPVRKHVNEICVKLWRTELEFTMIAASRLLGKQIQMPQSRAPSHSKCIRTLRLAATYARAAATAEGKGEKAVTTPLASAAAAVALWRLAPSASDVLPVAGKDSTSLADLPKIDRESSAYYVRAAARNNSTLAGDYIAWHIARSGHNQAFALGLTMLPAFGAPRPVYNDNERSAGAMLLSLAAKTPAQRAEAIKRINSRLTGGPTGGEDNYYVTGAYRCALLILAQVNREQIRHLLATGEFPQRRAITALLAAGDREVLDDLLWAGQTTPEDIIFLLLHKGIGEVLAELAGDLPRLNAAEADINHWQVKILRDYYAIHRNDIKVGLKR